jgi:NAD-dependent DNA ligase
MEHGLFTSVVNTTRAAYGGNHTGQVLAVFLGKCVANDGCIIGAARCHCVNQRKCRFAFIEIVTDLLSRDLGIAGVVENIVNHLKGNA